MVIYRVDNAPALAKIFVDTNAWWLNGWKRKEKTNIIRRFSFSLFFGRKWMSIYVFVSFSAVNGISFSSEFSFTAENEKCFLVGLIHHKRSWSWSWTLGLVLVLVLKKVLITSLKNGRETNVSRRLKQFDGLTWLTPIPAIFHDRSTPLVIQLTDIEQFAKLVRCRVVMGRCRYLTSVSVFSIFVGIFSSRFGIRYRYFKI